MYQVDPVRPNSSIWRQENQERISKCWERERAESDPIKKRTIADERIHCINQARLGWPWEYTDDGSYEEWITNGCKPAPVYTREMDDVARVTRPA